jgi:Dna[CI] antecedent, DciA
MVDQVRADLPARLAVAVQSAGVEHGKLTIGVNGAVWASRIRYLTESLRISVSEATGVAIQSVRVRVVPPGPDQL